MAKIIFGFGTSHSPLLSTPADKWNLRVEADKQNPSLEYRGKSPVLEWVLALKPIAPILWESRTPSSSSS
ncbi:MAG: hypothetical protein O2963_05725, partial [Proteobacteria bacterium]|nr:hypothetical protein [Pseudomonadota bacterium]